MAYPDDLLQFAQEMASLHIEQAHQPSLRRAVSSGYYALFHLLILDAIANCSDPQFRAALARMFDHGPMKQASDRNHLYNVAETFSQAQQERNDADYDLLKEWQPAQVSLLPEGIADAFQSWNTIRREAAARDFLISMLSSRERKQSERTRSKPRASPTDAPRS